VLNWELLGYGKGKQNLWEGKLSKAKQDRLNKAVNAAAAEYLQTTFLKGLLNLFYTVPSVQSQVSTTEELVINVTYPAAFDLSILRPQVKLEIGPLASRIPSDRHYIKPYAAEDFGHLFDDPLCPIIAIKAERTFWEKATILHQQAHRKTKMPPAYSRHYYDLYMLANSPVKDIALKDLPLLADVVHFKQRFYHCPWARYDEAIPGTFRLVPADSGIKELEKDYRQMRNMIFSSPPEWGVILKSLSQLEEEINNLA